MITAAIGADAIGAVQLRTLASEWGGARPAAAGALTGGVRAVGQRERAHRPHRDGHKTL